LIVLESGTGLFNKEILDHLLLETDKNLTQSADLVLIGGTALVVQYQSPRSTLDVDAYTSISQELKKAWNKAEKTLGIKIPLSKSPISEGPYNMEDRFLKYGDLNLQYLNIFVPEAGDLILMKTLRLFGKDRDDISHLIRHSKIHERILLKRFIEEMDHVVCERKTLRSHYLFVIEENYGKKVADRHERALGKK